MKHLLKALIVVFITPAFALAQVSYAPLMVNRTNISLPPSSSFFAANSNVMWSTVGPQFAMRPLLTDADADEYAFDVGLVDIDERIRVSQFVQGLKNMGLWCNAKLILSLRTNHQVASGTTAYAIKGNHPTVVGSPTRDSNGFTFDGGGSAYLTFTNPFSTTITNISAVVAFKANKGGAMGIVSGYGSSPNRSFGLFANGSPTIGTDTNSLVMDGSSDGSALLPYNAGRYISDYNSSARRQTAFAGFSAAEYSINGGFELRRTSSTNGTFGTMANPNTVWRIGNGLTGNALNGEVAFVALWDQYLTESQYLAVRRLYISTIGQGYHPTTGVIVEGDSITAGGGSEGAAVKSWHKLLIDDSTWGPLVSRRNISEGGIPASTIATTLSTQSLLYAIDARYVGPQYFMINAGINDLVSASAATTYAHLASIYARARAVGQRVVAFTITPSANFTTNQAAERIVLNQMIRTNSAAYDYLVDLGMRSTLTNTANTTYFQSDGVHLTQAGQAEILAALLNVIPTP